MKKDYYFLFVILFTSQFCRAQNEITAVERILEMGVYPNPNTGSFALVLPNDCEIESIQVTNIGGIIQKFELYRMSSTTCDVILKNAEKGVYLVNVTCNNGSVFTNKIMVTTKGL